MRDGERGTSGRIAFVTRFFRIDTVRHARSQACYVKYTHGHAEIRIYRYSDTDIRVKRTRTHARERARDSQFPLSFSLIHSLSLSLFFFFFSFTLISTPTKESTIFPLFFIFPVVIASSPPRGPLVLPRETPNELFTVRCSEHHFITNRF